MNAPVGSSTSPAAPGTGKFFAVALFVVFCLAVIGVGIYFLPKTEFFKGDQEPWMTYEERLREVEVEGSIANVYSYRSKEVDTWIVGAQAPGIEAASLRNLLTRAVNLLSLTDATRIIEAAHAAQPGHHDVIAASATSLREKAGTASAEERDCRVRLTRIIGQPED